MSYEILFDGFVERLKDVRLCFVQEIREKLSRVMELYPDLCFTLNGFALEGEDNPELEFYRLSPEDCFVSNAGYRVEGGIILGLEGKVASPSDIPFERYSICSLKWIANYLDTLPT